MLSDLVIAAVNDGLAQGGSSYPSQVGQEVHEEGWGSNAVPEPIAKLIASYMKLPGIGERRRPGWLLHFGDGG